MPGPDLVFSATRNTNANALQIGPGGPAQASQLRGIVAKKDAAGRRSGGLTRSAIFVPTIKPSMHNAEGVCHFELVLGRQVE